MSQFFRLLVKVSQPLRTSQRANSDHDDCSEEKTRRDRSANALRPRLPRLG